MMRMSIALSLSLSQVGFLNRLIIIGPGSKHAYFIYSNGDRVEEILSKTSETSVSRLHIIPICSSSLSGCQFPW
jgi:hypothetical protein